MDVKELIGVTLGTCTLERVVGRGGMGAVFMAQQSRPVRTVAVKVLIPPPGYEEDQEGVFLARFRREADTVARLEHKNILPIYEYDEALVHQERLAYLVMPFMRGGTLRDRINDMKRSGSYFDLHQVASYISQVADALSYAHSQGVVHRDVKPGNLIFHQDGRLLLSDFGIVRLKAQPSLTSVGSFLGTVEYASPEQISSGEIDFRSDIYSLGIILYELLTNTVPFDAPSPFLVMSEKLSKPVPSVRNIRPELSEGIDEVVMKALARNPSARYQTATMLAADLRAAVASSAGGHVLRITGDALNDDLTVSEPSWGVAAPLEAGVAAPGIPTMPPLDFPATQPARPAPPGSSMPGVAPWPAPRGNHDVNLKSPPGGSMPGVAPWQQPARQWQWPSQAQDQAAEPNESETAELGGAPSPKRTRNIAQTRDLQTPTYATGRRLFFYAVIVLAILLQFLVLPLLFTKNAGTLPLMLGVLIASGIDLLALAAISFASVNRQRNTRKFVIVALINALLGPLLSGFILKFGTTTQGIYPIIAYILLLLSNIYALRQLALVDAGGEQVEVAPVHWRPAALGALTGLLPLTIILVFALEAPFTHLHGVAPLLNLFGTLLIVFLGTPTPGSVMAVRLMEDMRFPSLLRTSGLAGVLMFLGASVLVTAWGLLFPNHTQFLYNLHETWMALLLIVAVLCVVGGLRGMMDAWVYERIRERNRRRPAV